MIDNITEIKAAVVEIAAFHISMDGEFRILQKCKKLFKNIVINIIN